MTKARALTVNPPDLWIHGNAADVADVMSDDDRDSAAQLASHAARSDRTGLFLCC